MTVGLRTGRSDVLGWRVTENWHRGALGEGYFTSGEPRVGDELLQHLDTQAAGQHAGEAARQWQGSAGEDSRWSRSQAMDAVESSTGLHSVLEGALRRPWQGETAPGRP